MAIIRRVCKETDLKVGRRRDVSAELANHLANVCGTRGTGTTSARIVRDANHQPSTASWRTRQQSWESSDARWDQRSA